MGISWRAASSVCAVLALTAVAAQAKDVKVVGVTVGSLGNPYFVATDKGITAKAKEVTPNARVTFVASDYDLSKQVGQIDSFTASGAQIIMLNAADPAAIGSTVAKARAAGVIVAAFDVAAANADLTVMTDNVKAGSLACQYIVDHLPGKAGNVLIINGPQVSSIVDRVKGCKQVLGTETGIKILSDDQDGKASRDGGLALGKTLLTRFPKIDAVFAINDQSALGFELAAKQTGRSEMMITSVDGAPEIIADMKEKGSLVKATSAQDPYGMAADAYALAVKLANGEKPAQTVTLLEPKLVTLDNIASYKGWDPTEAK